MRLYIPEIGDKLVLAKDWTFTLYRESRNDDLWRLFKLDDHPNVEAARLRREEIRAQIEDLQKTMVSKPLGYNLWNGAPAMEMVFRNKEDGERLRDLFDQDYYHSNPGAPVTLPVGTQLTVDRVYIRKGASEFSSLSFYITASSHPLLQPQKGVKGFKGGRKRFWAKLSDCNSIEFAYAEG